MWTWEMCWWWRFEMGWDVYVLARLVIDTAAPAAEGQIDTHPGQVRVVEDHKGRSGGREEGLWMED